MPEWFHDLRSFILDLFDSAYWFFRSMWAKETGRWYYLRDAPNHVVALFASSVVQFEAEDEFSAVGREAIKERALRRRQGEWDDELDSEFDLSALDQPRP